MWRGSNDLVGGTAGTDENNPIQLTLVPRATNGSSLLVRNTVEITYLLDSGFLGVLSLF